MRGLRKEFIGKGEVKGDSFKMIKESDKAYLFARTNKSGVTHYEVFKRVENTRFGVVSYPTSKAFGLWAWSIFSKSQAEQKFLALNL